MSISQIALAFLSLIMLGLLIWGMVYAFMKKECGQNEMRRAGWGLIVIAILSISSIALILVQGAGGFVSKAT